jgi:hypothetical protein
LADAIFDRTVHYSHRIEWKTNTTKPMIAEAVSAGFYKSPSGATFPRIQLLELRIYFAARRARDTREWTPAR